MNRIFHPFSPSLRASNVALFLFCINYGLFGFGLSLNTANLSSISVGSRTVIFNLVLIVCLYFLVSHAQTSDPIIRVKLSTIGISISATIIAIISSFPIYKTFLTGDELAYTSNSWLHATKIIELFQTFIVEPKGDWLDNYSIIEYLRIPILVSVFLIAIYSRIYRETSRRNQIISIFVIFIMFRNLNDYFFHFSFQYLSGYTFPVLFASILHPTDFAIRISNALFFFLILSLGLQNSKREIHKYIWIAPIILMLFLDSFSHFLPFIDTVTFYLAFGCVVLFRLANFDLYNFQATLWISCFAIFFRPANAVWLILTLFVAYSRKYPRLKSIETLKPLLLVAPFAVDALLQKFTKFFLGQGSDSAKGSENSYIVFFKSIYTANDKFTFLVLIVISLGLVLSRNLRAILIVYFVLILVVYIPFIPEGAVGLNKYPIESTLPIVFLGLCKSFQQLRLSSRSSRTIGYLVISINLMLGHFIFPSKVSADKEIDKTGQISTFIGYPLENRLTLAELNMIAPGYGCMNPGTLYGDSYFFLRGESFSNFELRHGNQLKSSSIYENDFNLLTKKYNCLVIDQFQNKAQLTSFLVNNDWKRIYFKKGKRFETSSEVWTLN